MDHIRIDEGISKSTPRSPLPDKFNDSKLSAAIPDDLDPKIVLDAYLCAETTSQIAAQFGYKRSTLTLWLREKCPEDWHNIQIARALIRKEDANENIENATDALSLARAREMLRSGQWDLERLDRRTYGQEQQVSLQINYFAEINQALPGLATELLGKLRPVSKPQQIEDAALLPLESVQPDDSSIK